MPRAACRVTGEHYQKVVAVYSAPGNSFGVRALVGSTTRAATVTCTEAGRLWALDRLSFRRLTLGDEIANAETGTRLDERLDEDEEHEEEALQAEETGHRARVGDGKADAIIGSFDSEASASVTSGDNGEQASEKQASEKQAQNGKGGASSASTAGTGTESAGSAALTHAQSLWLRARGVRITSFAFESFEDRQHRKTLLLSKSLRKVFDKLWEATETRYTRLGQEGYMNYHLSVSRAILELSDPGQRDAAPPLLPPFATATP